MHSTRPAHTRRCRRTLRTPGAHRSVSANLLLPLARRWSARSAPKTTTRASLRHAPARPPAPRERERTLRSSSSRSRGGHDYAHTRCGGTLEQKRGMLHPNTHPRGVARAGLQQQTHTTQQDSFSTRARVMAAGGAARRGPPNHTHDTPTVREHRPVTRVCLSRAKKTPSQSLGEAQRGERERG